MAGQPDFISHWHHLFENFQTSPLGFYQSVETAVNARSIPQTHWSQVRHREAGLGSEERIYLRIQRGRFAFDICAAPFGTGFFVSWWFTEPPLKFAILYSLGLFWAIALATFIAFGVGSTFGMLVGGYQLGAFLGGSCGFVGVPVLLWLVGNFMRQGRIAGETIILAMPVFGWIYEKVFTPPTFYAMDTALMFEETVSKCVSEAIDAMTADKGVRALTEAERKPILKSFSASA